MKGTVVKIKHNAVIAKLVDPTKEVRLVVSEILSYKAAGSEHSAAFASGGWDGYSSFFEMRKNCFPAGFVRFVKKKLELRGCKVYMQRTPVPEPQGPENPIVDAFGNNDARYDYQMETVNRLVSLKTMIAQIATGGGKSRVFKLACARLNLPTLFVTTRKSLMYQMAAQMEDQGREIGIIGDGTWNPKPNGINFAIVDTITSRLEVPDYEKEVRSIVEKLENEVERLHQAVLDKKGIKISDNMLKFAPAELRQQVEALREAISRRVYDGYGKKNIEINAKAAFERKVARRQEMVDFLRQMIFVVLEEAHEVSGNGFYDLMNQCHNAAYRLALTATPFMKDDEEANMRLMAVTGPVGIKVSEKLLIDRGILAKPHFWYCLSPRSSKVFAGTPWQRAYKFGVVEAKERNEIIVAESVRATQYGLPVMILVQHTAHGNALKKLLKAQGLKADFISGGDDQKARQAALDKLKAGTLNVLIGSTILDVGVDVPAVGLVILAGGGKAEVALRQRIGRGLRAKKSGPNVCFIIDFDDRHNNHLRGHSQARRAIVEDTPGFAENIFDQPFNYEDFGIIKL